MEDGYIKFNVHLKKEKVIKKEEIKELNRYRNKLKEMNLIGMKDNGVGFGNISIKYKKGFIITASKTGGIENLKLKDYSYVYDYDLDKNELYCKGYKNASSESLSHAAVYESNSKIKSVIHVHSMELWEKHLGKIPTTSK
ncbi:MAG: class II aldolase/adducin family protein, partial [Candidatus Woesearchaeota archaeon]